MFEIRPRLFLTGFAVWLAATIALRFAGQFLLRPGHWAAIFALFLVSFPLMAWVVRGICRELPGQEWLAAGVSVLLPTLLLDPFSSAFFPTVFPNMAPEMAGVFGGWMLWCCAGALVGASVRA